MEAQSPSFSQLPQAHAARVDSSGRIVVPVELRERWQIQPGHHLILEEEHGHLTVRTYEQVLEDLQNYCADLAPPEVLLSEQLIQERRAEAARELRELQGPAGSHD